MAVSQVEFDQLLGLIPRLSPEQTQTVRQQLEDYWFHQFGEALKSIHANVPTDISEDDIQADIEAAIHEVRA